MRREILYLTDIVEASDHLAAFIAGITFEQFEQSELIRSAVAQKLAIIGEAAGHISSKLRNREPELPWPKIVAFRNILIHGYFGIDWVEVWQVAKHRCPGLRDQIARILTQESDRPE
jgi:uncharacterized protein with HEPN domain